MSDMNELTKQINFMLESNGFPDKFDELKGGLIFGGDVILHISPQFSVVGSYDRATSSTDGLFIVGTDFFRVENSVEGDFFSAGIMVYPAPTWPLYACAKGGVGFGRMVQESRMSAPSLNPPLELTGSADGNGRKFIAEVGLGGTTRFGAGNPVVGFIELSYRYRNLGSFDGITARNSEWRDGPLKDGTGKTLEFDYSGVAFKAGLGVEF